jgi:hypothetical protein
VWRLRYERRPPTQVKYEKKKTERKNHKGEDINYYVARPVMTTAGLTAEQQNMGVTEAQRLERKEKVDKLLKTVMDIKDVYNQKPPAAKQYFWRDAQIQTLVKSAEKILKDPKMPAEEKEAKIMQKLQSLQNKISREKKIKSFFGFESKNKGSRLSDAIKSIVSPESSKPGASTPPSQLPSTPQPLPTGTRYTTLGAGALAESKKSATPLAGTNQGNKPETPTTPDPVIKISGPQKT